MLRRLLHILMVAMVFFATTAPCLCHVHMSVQSCCQKAEAQAQDCCCSKTGTMADQVPAPEAAMLPVVWEFSQLQAVVLPETTVVVPSPLLPSRGRECQDILRSPPDLYLLYASLLI